MWYQAYLDVDSIITLSNKICAIQVNDNSPTSTLTYGQLPREAQFLATQLLSLDTCTPGNVIGVMMDPSVNFLVAVHAIWLTGSPYLSLDPSYPADRLLYMIEDSGVKIIITEENYIIDANLLSQMTVDRNLTSIVIGEDTLMRGSGDINWKKQQRCVSTNNSNKTIPNLNEDDLAYVIYTSGSTGKPKGVGCAHSGLANLCKAHALDKGLNRTTIHLQFGSTSFDTSVGEIFPTLFAFGKLVFASKEQKLPGPRLANLIRQNNVTDISLASSILGMMNEFADSLDSLKRIVLAGEPCLPSLVNLWSKPGRVLVNEYGPTEATVCSTSYQVPFPISSGETKIPIGKPIRGVRTYVVNENTREKCPLGVAGELAIGGKGVAKGYVNKPELTSQSFRHLPSVNDFCFLTGDSVVEDHDGNLYFLGRLDRQIKIRGFRVELAEIENITLQISGIRACAVKIFAEIGENGMEDKVIVAYVVAKLCSTALSAKTVKEYVSNILPDYMVPNYVIFLEKLPLMPNGVKVDKNALPPLRHTICKARLEKSDIVWDVPKNSVECLCGIFDRGLNLSAGTIAPDDNFFNFGGNSLKVCQVLMDIEKAFGKILPSWSIFEKPTPRSLLTFVENVHSLINDSFIDFRTYTSVLEKKLENLSMNNTCLLRGTELQTILLTGSTGFLGSHLLSILVKHENVEKIYCLVRGKDDEEAFERLHQTFSKYRLHFEAGNSKVVSLCGDISKDLLGLEASEYINLASFVTVVVHTAGDINYMKSYSELHNVNVEGVARLLQFSAVGVHKTFHHISSLSIFGAEYTLLGIDPVDESYDIQRSGKILRFENGYVQSKWRAECLVGIARRRGLQVNIYRTGVIAGNSITGIGNESDLFSRLLMGCYQMGAYPDFPDRYWTALPVDNIAEIIGHIVCSGEGVGRNYHICPDRLHEPSHNEIFEMVNSLDYCNKNRMKKWTVGKWLDHLKTVQSGNALHPLVPYLTEKVYFGKRSTLELHHRTSQVLNNNTHKALSGSGVEYLDLSKELLNCYVEYFNSLGLIAK